MKAQSYQLWAALVVEIHKALVSRHPGLLRVPYLSRFIDALMDHWIEWRIEKTLEDVDAQVEAIHRDLDQKRAQPLYSETLEGETPLGGEMRLQAPWVGREVGYDREEL